MQANGVGANQRTQVRGFADQRLRKIDNPLDPSNRRISIIVHYIIKNSDEEDAKPVPVGERGHIRCLRNLRQQNSSRSSLSHL
jgi:hypothetical protein